ncbi:hypothetical protein B0E43_12805 [Algoriphagus sp. A40]|nr:hypothetical protein B0E43_12805 [Algoriphagus sp. A40]
MISLFNKNLKARTRNKPSRLEFQTAFLMVYLEGFKLITSSLFHPIQEAKLHLGLKSESLDRLSN